MKMQLQLPVEFALQVEAGPELKAVLADIVSRLIKLEQSMGILDDKITELGNVVAAQGTVIESAIALMDGLFDQLTAAIAANSGNTAAQVTAVQAVIDAAVLQKDALAAKVLENTPAA